jgi:PAS domain-containing protein
MRIGKSLRDASPNAESISQALTIQLRTEYDVAQPYPANIDTLLQRLVCQEIDRETAQERDRIWKLSQDLLMVTDLNGKVVDINPAWSATLGWSADDLVGDTAEWLIHPDDRNRSFRELVNEAQETAHRTSRCASSIRTAAIACSPYLQCATASSSTQAPGTSPI